MTCSSLGQLLFKGIKRGIWEQTIDQQITDKRIRIFVNGREWDEDDFYSRLPSQAVIEIKPTAKINDKGMKASGAANRRPDRIAREKAGETRRKPLYAIRGWGRSQSFR